MNQIEHAYNYVHFWTFRVNSDVEFRLYFRNLKFVVIESEDDLSRNSLTSRVIP